MATRATRTDAGAAVANDEWRATSVATTGWNGASPNVFYSFISFLTTNHGPQHGAERARRAQTHTSGRYRLRRPTAPAAARPPAPTDRADPPRRPPAPTPPPHTHGPPAPAPPAAPAPPPPRAPVPPPRPARLRRPPAPPPATT